MKKAFLYLAFALIVLVACNEKEDDHEQNPTKSIYGTWVSDLVNAFDTLIINEDGTGKNFNGEFTYTFKDNILAISNDFTSKVNIVDDVMTWQIIDEYSDPKVIDMMWYRKDGVFDNKLTDGRWDASLNGEEKISYTFKGNQVDLYITTWGMHFSGTYTHANGILTLNITEGERLIEGSEEEWHWEVGNMNPQTFEPTGAYHWVAMVDDPDADYLHNMSDYVLQLKKTHLFLFQILRRMEVCSIYL